MDAVLDHADSLNLRGARMEKRQDGLFDVTVTEAGRTVHIERGVSFKRGADIIEEQMFQGGNTHDDGQC